MLAEELRELLVRDLPRSKATGDQVRKILQSSGQEFEVFDQRYAGVSLE